MKPITPVFYVDLLPKIDQKLLEILQTIVPQWRVKERKITNKG